MTKKSRYFLTTATSSYLEFDLDYPSAGIVTDGSEISFTGNSGVDSVVIGRGVSFDFTKASGGRDVIFLKGASDNYVFGLDGSTLTLTDSLTGALVKISGGTTFSSDNVVFRNGSISSKALLDAVSANQTISSSLLNANETTPLVNESIRSAISGITGAQVKAFVSSSEGGTFALSPIAGAKLTLYGNSGVDIAYIARGSNVDATRLSGGTDELYFTGALSEYDISVDGSTLVLSRSLGAQTEQVWISGGTSFSSDKLVFSDGFVSSYALYTAVNNGSTFPSPDGSLRTPGLELNLLLSSLDGVQNLDVRSDIVLTFNEAVEAGTGFIRIVNDANAGTKLGYAGENVTNTFVISVTDSSQVQIIGNKVIINPGYDLDFSNNYHVEIDAGAFVGVVSGLESGAVTDVTTLNFATVTPDTSKSVSSAAALSKLMNDSGGLVDSLYWFDTTGWGDKTSSSAVGVDFGSKNIGLLVADLDPLVGVFNGGEAETNVRVSNFNLAVSNFGADDLLYVDDLGRNNPNEDTSLTTQLVFGISVTSGGGNSNFNFDPIDGTVNGGSIDILGQVINPELGVESWKTILSTTNNVFLYA